MSFLCHQCYVGRLSADRAPYFFQLEEGPVIAPQVPALVCDFCDYVEYDPDVILRITFLMQSPVPQPPEPTSKPKQLPLRERRGAAKTRERK